MSSFDDPIASDESKFDYRVLSGIKEPWQQIHDLQARARIPHSEIYGGHWIVTRHADVLDATRRNKEFSSAEGSTLPLAAPDFQRAIPVEIDLPKHRWFRQPVLDKFSPAAIAERLPFHKAVVADLVDRTLERGRVEAVGELLQPMVGEVMAELMDAPREDMPQLVRFAQQAMSGVDAQQCLERLRSYSVNVWNERRNNPKDDIPTVIAHMVIDGEPITEADGTRMIQTLMTAGLDTTVSAGSHMLEWLAEHPDSRRELASDLSAVPTAIEEFLRFVTPIPGLRRVTTSDLELGGCPIPAGESVLLLYMSANHDPAEFPDPEHIDFRRSPNRHVTFGTGIHRCLGAHLARQELRCLLEEILVRMPDFRLDPDDPGLRHEGTTRGLSRLPLLLGPE